MRDKGFTPTQLEQLNRIIEYQLSVQQGQESDPAPGVRRINFSGSLDSRELVGNILDGVIHEAASWPLRIIRSIF